MLEGLASLPILVGPPTFSHLPIVVPSFHIKPARSVRQRRVVAPETLLVVELPDPSLSLKFDTSSFSDSGCAVWTSLQLSGNNR